MSDGVEALQDGSMRLRHGTAELDGGVLDLMDGITELSNGSQEMKDGTSEFRTETEDMDTRVSDQIQNMTKEITGSGNETVSFVSAKNTQVESVQFVMRTGAITIPEPEEPPEVASAPLTFWQKLRKLFGPYRE